MLGSDEPFVGDANYLIQQYDMIMPQKQLKQVVS